MTDFQNWFLERGFFLTSYSLGRNGRPFKDTHCSQVKGVLLQGLMRRFDGEKRVKKDQQTSVNSKNKNKKKERKKKEGKNHKRIVG